MASSLSLWFSLQSSPRCSWRSIRCNTLLRCVCRVLMYCGFMTSLEYYLNLLWILICMIWYLCKSLWTIDLVWPIRLVFLAMGEVLSFGFNLAMIYIQVTKRDKTRICIVDIKDKTMGFIHIAWLYFVYIMSSFFRSYSVLYELNTLHACWIAFDVWSNSSRCRKESVYLSWTWCLYTWSLPWISSWLFIFLSISQQ